MLKSEHCHLADFRFASSALARGLLKQSHHQPEVSSILGPVNEALQRAQPE